MAYTKDDWWIETPDGRRIGWLWPEDFATILESRYGERQWVNAFSRQFGFSRTQVDRWRNGATPIPKHVAMIVNMLGVFNTRQVPLSNIEADWLPEVEGTNGRLGLPDPVEKVRRSRAKKKQET